VDYSFHLNIRGDVSPRLAEIPALVERGFPSFKVFMAYEGFRLEDADLVRVMQAVSRANGVVSVHAEDGPLADAVTAGLLAGGLRAPAYFGLARPAACEEQAIRRILAHQQQTGARLHIHHVSTRAGAAAIGQARRSGRMVSGETCPHYLLFSAADYAGDPSQAAALVCSPSIKDGYHQPALWQALAEDALSVLATDHCPYTRAQKEAHLDDFSQIPGGLAGVETRLPLMYSAGVAAGRLSLARFAQVWAEGPARAFGLYPRKGTLSVGSDADLVLVDPQAAWTLRAADLHMNTDCLAYEGQQGTGKPVATILGGRVIVQDGKMLAEPCGQLNFRKF
jgi:dihydropyrimidinase